MGVIVAVAVRMATRVVVRVGVARAVGMGVHFCQVYSTSLPPRTHPEGSSCYWKL